MKRIRIARADIRLLDFTTLSSRDDGVEAYVTSSSDDPVIIETRDADRFSRWLNALKDAGREFEVLG